MKIKEVYIISEKEKEFVIETYLFEGFVYIANKRYEALVSTRWDIRDKTKERYTEKVFKKLKV